MSLPWYMSKYEKQVQEKMKNGRINWKHNLSYVHTSVFKKFDFLPPRQETLYLSISAEIGKLHQVSGHFSSKFYMNVYSLRIFPYFYIYITS